MPQGFKPPRITPANETDSIGEGHNCNSGRRNPLRNPLIAPSRLGLAAVLPSNGPTAGTGWLVNHVPSQAQLFHGHNRPIRHINLPPAVAVLGHTLVGVVVVVPAFTKGQKPNPPEIPRVIGCLVVAVAPDVRGGIHKPCDVKYDHHPHSQAPQQPRNRQAGTAHHPAQAQEREADENVPQQKCLL